jgi:phosphoadenosine phosphosulfate reductase
MTARRSPRAWAPKTWCCSTRSPAPARRSTSSSSTPAASTPRPSSCSSGLEPATAGPSRSSGPLEAQVAGFVRQHGLNGFYDGVAERHLCCGIRKVEPLGRALEGRDAWLTGQRRAQGPERASLPLEETDLDRGIAKHNPLAFWSDEDVRGYIARHDVPLNALHARGYPSIGCEPCTRAVRPGEDPRAGRWWWERGTAKECGLHLPKIVVEQAAAR